MATVYDGIEELCAPKEIVVPGEESDCTGRWTTGLCTELCAVTTPDR